MVILLSAFHSILHRALIRSQKMVSLFGNNLSIGQRVYISGDLQTTDFVTDQNKMRQMFQINVHEMYATKQTDGEMNTADGDRPKGHLDQNSVSMLAHIASDIQHFGTICRFILAINSVTR